MNPLASGDWPSVAVSVDTPRDNITDDGRAVKNELVTGEPMTGVLAPLVPGVPCGVPASLLVELSTPLLVLFSSVFGCDVSLGCDLTGGSLTVTVTFDFSTLFCELSLVFGDCAGVVEIGKRTRSSTRFNCTVFGEPNNKTVGTAT
jgi:hypothetical protein